MKTLRLIVFACLELLVPLAVVCLVLGLIQWVRP